MGYGWPTVIVSVAVAMIAAAVAGSVSVSAAEPRCGRDAVVFVFGDSNSDTGGLKAAMGLEVALPNGRAFFHRSTGRFSDGRLVLDFLCDSLNTSYITQYLDSLGSGFRNGANFAIAGSGTLPRYKLFSLHIQVLQFLLFKSRSLDLVTHGTRDMIDEDGFQKAIYIIDIGQNDLSDAFTSNLSYDQVVGSISNYLNEIRDAIKILYDNGGKKFWIHNTGPLGCLPQKLSFPRRSNSELDPNGCLVAYNNAAKKFNAGLSVLCDEMSSELKSATIVYTDIYTIKYDLVANYAKYGFVNPVTSCCGYGGGRYNYNINVTCGNPGAQACQNGLRYVSWDGVHYTEAANAIVASKVLSTDYSRPKIKFNYFCRD